MEVGNQIPTVPSHNFLLLMLVFYVIYLAVRFMDVEQISRAGLSVLRDRTADSSVLMELQLPSQLGLQ